MGECRNIKTCYYKPTPTPEPLYEDDPDLKKGVTVQVDFPAWGATATFTRIVKRGDDVLFTDTFLVNINHGELFLELVQKKIN